MLQALTALKGTSTNIKRKNGTREIILPKYLINVSYLASFFGERNCLGFGIFAAMLCHHSSVWFGASAGTTVLRRRGLSGLASACLSDGEIRCKINRQGRWFLSWRLPEIFLWRTGIVTIQ